MGSTTSLDVIMFFCFGKVKMQKYQGFLLVLYSAHKQAGTLWVVYLMTCTQRRLHPSGPISVRCPFAETWNLNNVQRRPIRLCRYADMQSDLRLSGAYVIKQISQLGLIQLHNETIGARDYGLWECIKIASFIGHYKHINAAHKLHFINLFYFGKGTLIKLV